MSLVGAFMGNVLFGHKASMREDDVVDIQMEVDQLAENIRDMAPQLEAATSNINQKQRNRDSMLRYYDSLKSQISSGNLKSSSPQARLLTEVMELIYKMNEEINTAESAKIQLEVEKNKIARDERLKQSELKAAEVQLQLAKQFQETDQKMQQGAIKRFAINI